MYRITFSNGETELYIRWEDLVSDMRYFHHPFDVTNLISNKTIHFNNGDELL